jgi:hypothetical protein
MSRSDDELRELLHAADPAADLPAAEPGHLAQLLEDIMSNDVDTPTPIESRRRSPLTWLVAAAAVLVIAGVGAFTVLNRDGSHQVPGASAPPVAKTVFKLQAKPPGAAAMCMRVAPDTLANMQVAFDGTVTSISDSTVTLDVSHWYRGGDGADQVTVTAPPSDLHILLGAVSFETGQRYLVTAYGGNVTVCGFTAPYSDQLAAMYQQAFGS